MNFKLLFEDDRAVSPVIGVILMVAITVILAAVIGTFVLGLGSGLQQTAPQATFDYDQSTSAVAGVDTTSVEIVHATGDSLEAANLEVLVDGAPAYTEGSTADTVAGTFSGTVSAGTSITIVAATSSTVDTSTAIYADLGSDGDIDIDNDGNTSTAGDQITDVGLSSSQTVSIIWNSPEGDTSATLSKYEIR